MGKGHFPSRALMPPRASSTVVNIRLARRGQPLAVYAAKWQCATPVQWANATLDSGAATTVEDGHRTPTLLHAVDDACTVGKREELVINI